MIDIKVNCIGITPSFQKHFFLTDHIDQIIFFNTYERIKLKVNRGLRINLDESIWLYCGYIVKEIKVGNDLDQIKDKVSKLLSHKMVMIGVSEILKKITVEVLLEKRQICFEMDNLFDTSKGFM